MFKKHFFSKKKSASSKSILSLLSSSHISNTEQYSEHQLITSGFHGNIIANRCINIIAKSISSISWNVVQDNKKLKNHILLDLISSPNSEQSQYSFFDNLLTDLLTLGNAYILFEENKKHKSGYQLKCLNPTKVKILVNKNQEVKTYKYNNNTDYVKHNDPIRDKVLHLKFYNPVDKIYGLSPLRIAMKVIEQHNNALTWNKELLSNSARPSGAIIINQEINGGILTNEQYERIKDQLAEHYMGYHNVGKPMLLEGGLEWKEMSLSPKDMEFSKTKDNAAREIALSFGVPPQMLGIPGDNTYSNMAEARLSLWEQTIIPTVDMIKSYLNHWLIKKFADNLSFEYDKNKIPALEPRQENLWKRVSDASFLTNDEKKQLLELN